MLVQRTKNALVLANPGRNASLAAVGGGPAREFHRRLPGYAVTPLVAAPTLAADLGLEQLWVKVESM